jgi:hypothetical protein
MGTLVAAFVCLAGSVGAADAAKTPAKKAAKPAAFKIWPAADIKFADVEGMKGAQVAPLWGDMKKGAYGAFFKWVGGFDAGWHSHSHAVRVVTVSGTFTLDTEAQGPKEFAPGSYIWDPGKLKHRSGCKAGAECVFLVSQDAAFDFIPVEAKK